MTAAQIVIAAMFLSAILAGIWHMAITYKSKQLLGNWKDHVDNVIVDGLTYLDKHPELALPARIVYIRELLDDLAIDLAKNIKSKKARAPMMEYIKFIDTKLV